MHLKHDGNDVDSVGNGHGDAGHGQVNNSTISRCVANQVCELT